MVNPKSADQTQIFSDRLTGSRHARGLTQAELAEKSGVSLRSVQNWEGGISSTPRPALLRSLAAVLRVSPDYLLGNATSYDSPAPFVEGASAVNPGIASIPPWLADLCERLQRHDEPRRRRILAIVHSILDLIDPHPAATPAPVAVLDQSLTRAEDRFAAHPDPTVQAMVEMEEKLALERVLKSTDKTHNHKGSSRGK